MIILRANISHKEGIQQLENELNTYRDSIFSKATIAFHSRIQAHQLISDEDLDSDIFFIAKSDSGEIIGFIQGSIHERRNHTLHTLGAIDALYVRGEYRKMGFAKKLFLELEKELKNLGCDHITVHTDAENQLSQEFYQYMDMNNATIELWKAI